MTEPKKTKANRTWNEWYISERAVEVLICAIDDTWISKKSEAKERYPKDTLSRYKVTVTV